MTSGLAAVLVAIGLGIGLLSGMIGIGGGVLVIPILMFFFDFEQARANGTSLAMMLPPVGVFAVLTYARAGNVDWRFALLLAIGLTAGAFAGGWALNRGLINPTALRIVFALLMMYIAGRLLFRASEPAGAALKVSLLVIAYGVAYIVMRALGRRWQRMPYVAGIYHDMIKDNVDRDYEI